MQMSDKNTLRAELKKRRAEMSEEEKESLDQLLSYRLFACESFRKADDLLIYVSTKLEVGTYEIIHWAFSAGKSVFTPRCIEGTNEMEFCHISSFYDLEPGKWGIYEPRSYCDVFTGSDNAICIAPALAYDRKGYRLGYGKGYYDRFLRSFNGCRMGICYDSYILDSVFKESFDVPVEMIITEKREIITDDEREE